jgi:hypothetical protein
VSHGAVGDIHGHRRFCQMVSREEGAKPPRRSVIGYTEKKTASYG